MTVKPEFPQAILTFDVEDWEHANFAQLDAQEQQVRIASRDRRYAMDANTDRWIELLGQVSAGSTCFVLGEFARRYPEAVRRLARAGHEIASHGDTHQLIYRMTRVKFREYLKRGLGELGELLGSAPIGFRAPSWSVSREKTPWFCEELAGQGVLYDSSEFPVRTPLYGDSSAPLRPYREAGLLRVPVTVLTIGAFRAPFSSGAFFRLAPLSLIRFGLRRAIQRGLPAMIVLHPRELDPEHPRLPLRGWEASVHYARLGSTVPKLQALLRDFNWRAIRDVFGSVLDRVEPTLDN